MDPLVILLIGMAVVVGGVLAFKLHAFIALIAAALVVAALTPTTALEHYADEQVKQGDMTVKQAAKFTQLTIGDRVGIAFGRTCGDIGILVALASIVGKCLLDSGGADRIVRSALRFFGEARAPLAFLISGYLLGIPVFFDTVFYLMIPLGKALRIRTGKNYILYVLTIVAGASMTHSLVPPTPGPLAVAEILHVNMAVMIAGGCVVGAFCAAAGYLFAVWINRRMVIPLRETSGTSLEELEALSRRDESELPPTWLALMPILLPIVLITGHEILRGEWGELAKQSPEGWHAQVLAITGTLGHKNIALLVAAAVAVGTLIWKQHTSRTQLARVIEECVMDAGTIILITAAGGAFGGVLQQTGIADRIADITPASQGWLLPLAFAVTAAIRTAQGSATVAMITGAGIFKAFALAPELPFHPVYLALAIGCGSKVMPWMNDSGFWVITRMSGMTEQETLRSQTPMLVVMGFVGVIATMLGAWALPLR